MSQIGDLSVSESQIDSTGLSREDMEYIRSSCTHPRTLYSSVFHQHSLRNPIQSTICRCVPRRRAYPENPPKARQLRRFPYCFAPVGSRIHSRHQPTHLPYYIDVIVMFWHVSPPCERHARREQRSYTKGSVQGSLYCHNRNRTSVLLTCYPPQSASQVIVQYRPFRHKCRHRYANVRLDPYAGCESLTSPSALGCTKQQMSVRPFLQ